MLLELVIEGLDLMSKVLELFVGDWVWLRGGGGWLLLLGEDGGLS